LRSIGISEEPIYVCKIEVRSVLRAPLEVLYGYRGKCGDSSRENTGLGHVSLMYQEKRVISGLTKTRMPSASPFQLFAMSVSFSEATSTYIEKRWPDPSTWDVCHADRG
jgi:hypothetical protein